MSPGPRRKTLDLLLESELLLRAKVNPPLRADMAHSSFHHGQRIIFGDHVVSMFTTRPRFV